MAGAGLGLRLHDNRHGTDHHDAAFGPWWQIAKTEYLSLDTDAAPTEVSLYYDPLLDVHHRLPVSFGLINCFYLAPQVPAEAQRLFDAAADHIGLTADAPDLTRHRTMAIALFLAKEWGRTELAGRLQDLVDEHWEPTWADGEFTWGLGLDEPHPRGQFNAFLAAAEAVGEGAWERLSAGPLDEQPQVVGVDFPDVALSEARWDGDTLHLAIDALGPGRETSFTITGLASGAAWQIDDPASLAAGDDGLVVTTPTDAGALTLSRRD